MVLESGYNCTNTDGLDTCIPECGDGLLKGNEILNEICDDNNTVDGDGCSSDCLVIENGFYCNTVGESCVTECGDGIKAVTEDCDDNNTNSNDGCSSEC